MSVIVYDERLLRLAFNGLPEDDIKTTIIPVLVQRINDFIDKSPENHVLFAQNSKATGESVDTALAYLANTQLSSRQITGTIIEQVNSDQVTIEYYRDNNDLGMKLAQIQDNVTYVTGTPSDDIPLVEMKQRWFTSNNTQIIQPKGSFQSLSGVIGHSLFRNIMEPLKS